MCKEKKVECQICFEEFAKEDMKLCNECGDLVCIKCSNKYEKKKDGKTIEIYKCIECVPICCVCGEETTDADKGICEECNGTVCPSCFYTTEGGMACGPVGGHEFCENCAPGFL